MAQLLSGPQAGAELAGGFRAPRWRVRLISVAACSWETERLAQGPISVAFWAWQGTGCVPSCPGWEPSLSPSPSPPAGDSLGKDMGVFWVEGTSLLLASVSRPQSLPLMANSGMEPQAPGGPLMSHVAPTHTGTRQGDFRVRFVAEHTGIVKLLLACRGSATCRVGSWPTAFRRDRDLGALARVQPHAALLVRDCGGPVLGDPGAAGQPHTCEPSVPCQSGESGRWAGGQWRGHCGLHWGSAGGAGASVPGGSEQKCGRCAAPKPQTSRPMGPGCSLGKGSPRQVSEERRLCPSWPSPHGQRAREDRGTWSAGPLGLQGAPRGGCGRRWGGRGRVGPGGQWPAEASGRSRGCGQGSRLAVVVFRGGLSLLLACATAWQARRADPARGP